MQQLETTIASLTERGEQLVARRDSAQDALDKAIQARRDTLLSGDLDDQRALGKMQTAVVAATSDLAIIEDALALLAQHRAEAEVHLEHHHETRSDLGKNHDPSAAISRKLDNSTQLKGRLTHLGVRCFERRFC